MHHKGRDCLLAPGIEYELDDKNTYPGESEEVTVIGRFETYKEGENLYNLRRRESPLL